MFCEDCPKGTWSVADAGAPVSIDMCFKCSDASAKAKFPELEQHCRTITGLSPAQVGGVAAGVTLFFLMVVGVLMLLLLRKNQATRKLRRPPDVSAAAPSFWGRGTDKKIKAASPDTTYAMTDIEDSTKLWEALSPSVMTKVMKLHDKCLSDATKECFGYLSFTEGDAFFVAFRALLFGSAYPAGCRD